METKTLVWIGLGVGGTVGGLLGSMLDHGNLLGAWSILLTAVGSCIGIWAGFRLGNS